MIIPESEIIEVCIIVEEDGSSWAYLFLSTYLNATLGPGALPFHYLKNPETGTLHEYGLLFCDYAAQDVGEPVMVTVYGHIRALEEEWAQNWDGGVWPS